MEMAKVTSKGQITIPISIRRRLGINEGDKILFVNKQEGVLMLNPDAVQGDIADYTADETVPAAAAPAAAAQKSSLPNAPKKQAPAQPSTDDMPAVAEPETQAPEDKSQKRSYIPPAADDSSTRPAAAPGGINLSTLLDDIRSIGSNI